MRRLALILVCLLFSLPSAHAAGLYSPDTGIVGLGRAGANTARAADLVSGLFHNPAGLWQLDGFNIEGGLHLIRTDRWFDRAGGEGIYSVDEEGNIIEGSLEAPFARTESLPHTRPIPEGGIAFGFEKPDLTIALGLYAPIAPIQRFPTYGPGRYRLVEQELIQGNISLSVGWRIADWIAVGASFQLLVMQLSETFTASADFLAANSGVLDEDPQWDVSASFAADALRPHFNVGVMVMPTPWLRIAARFEPPYRFEGTGTAQLEGRVGEQYLGDLPELLGGGGPVVVYGEDTEIAVSSGLPGRLRFGVGVEPVPGVFEIELDVGIEIWEGSGDVVASDVDVVLEHRGEDVGAPTPLGTYLDSRGLCGVVDCEETAVYRGEGGTGQFSVPADFGNSWSLHLGGEVRPIPILGIRFGALYESQGIGEDSLGLTMLDSHKVLAAGGLSLRLGAGGAHGSALDVHLTYAHTFYVDRTVSVEASRGLTKALPGVPSNAIDAGDYGGHSNQFGINVGAHFGAIHRYAKKSGSAVSP